MFVYGDDSSDERKERVTAIGIVLGSEVMWARLEPRWIARNEGVPFHAKDCESDQGDYRNIPHAENKALYRDLVTMLADSELGGLGVSIDLEAQRRIVPNSIDFMYYKAFMEMLPYVSRFSAQVNRIAKFTFDISTENEYNAALLYSYFKENEPEMSKQFAKEISFGSAKDSARLQVADLMAFEAMKALDNIVGPVKRKTRRSWAALQSTSRFETIAFSSDWFSDYRAHYADLEKIVGFNQKDYEQWLIDKRRHDDVSNRFHFLNWLAKHKNTSATREG